MPRGRDYVARLLRDGYVIHDLQTELFGAVVAVVPVEESGCRIISLIIGAPSENPLVRLHSRCTYGDVFGSQHCDCREQLVQTAACMRKEGGGVVIYLEQEGRGAGALAKARAYRAFAESGVDTFTYYESDGLDPDPRNYEGAALVLRALGFRAVRLLTNNPTKISALGAAGIDVERVPLVVPVDAMATAYIQAKRERGHLL